MTRHRLFWVAGCAALAFAFGILFLHPRSRAGRSSKPALKLVLQAPPATSVNSVAVSPDGSILATASGEGGVRLYDARTGAMLRGLGDVGDRSVVFSPDGRTLAAAGFHMDHIVGVYDVRTGKRVKSLTGQTEWEADATAISPDGRLLASTATDKQILVWDLTTGSLRHRFAGQPFRVPALAFSPDSVTLAAGGGDRTIRLWDMASGQVRRTLQGHGDWVCTVAFSPDGRTIASGSCDWAAHRGRNTAEFAWRDPGCVSEWKLWDAATGELKRTVSEPGRLLSLAFAPDGNSLACAIGREVRLYDLRRAAPGRVLTRYDFDATSVAFTPDGAAVISSSHDQVVRRVSVASGKVEWEAPGSWEEVNSVALSPDGSLLATGSSDRRFAVRTLKPGAPGLRPGAARLWDARTGRLLRRIAGKATGASGEPVEQVMAVAFSPGGRRVAVGGAGGRGSGIVRLCEAATGVAVWTAEDQPEEVLAVAFAPDGSSLATAGAEGVVKIRDPKTGRAWRSLAGHPGGATSLAFSADGATLVCGDGQGGAHIWEVRTGQRLRTCKALDSQAATVTTDRLFTTVAFTPGGATFAACPATVGNTYGEPARLWDARTGELSRQFSGGGRPIALSPDGAILAAGGKAVQVYDVRTGKPLRELRGYLKKTQALAFSADGRLLFGGGSWGTTNAWEVATGRHLVTLFAFPPTRKGAAGDDWLAYHPEGFYDGSPGAERYLAWRVGDELKTSLGPELRRPDQVAAALTLQPLK
jgi:WD40 repeat protein